MRKRHSSRPGVRAGHAWGSTIVILLALPSGGSHAKDTEPLPVPLIEREEVRFVTLDVVVEQRVRGIARGGWHRPGDVLENQVQVMVAGERMQIDLFENHCFASQGGGGASAAPERESSPVRSPALEEDPTEPEESLRYVLYFELEHLNLHGRHAAFAAAHAWANEMAGSNSEVMVITAGRGLRIVRDMAPIGPDLPLALESAKRDVNRTELWAAKESLRLRDINEAPGRGPARALSNQYARYEHFLTRRSLQHMRDLMVVFESIRGTKNLVLFSDTVRIVPGSIYRLATDLSFVDVELTRLAEAANDRNVRFYPVSAGVENWADSALTMLATETGGQYLQGTNNLEPIFEKVADDGSCFYRVGFRTRSGGSGRTRRVELEIIGRNGDHRLRYNRSLEDPTPAQRDEQAVRTAFLLPLSAQDFPAKVQSRVLSLNENGARVRIQVTAPIAELLRMPSPGGLPGSQFIQLQFGVQVIPVDNEDGEGTGDGSLAAWSGERLAGEPWGVSLQTAVTIPPGTGTPPDPDRIVLIGEFNAPPGEYRVIAVVQDRLAQTITAGNANVGILGDPPVLSDIVLATSDARAIVIDSYKETGARGVDKKNRRDRIAAARPFLPDDVVVLEEPALDARSAAYFFYTVCGENIDAGGDRHRESPGKLFDGWRVTHEVRCAEARVTINSPSQDLPAPDDNERCVPVVVPIPVQRLSPGTCNVYVELARPDRESEQESLAFQFLN